MSYHKFLAWIADLTGLNQKRCPNCLAPFTPESPEDETCPDCQKYFRAYRGPACPRCGDPATPVLCDACSSGRPWKAHAFHGIYKGHLRDLILRLKYEGEISLARYLAVLLLEASICLPKADAIVPLPQYPPHLFKRGFNHAHELGRHLAKMSGTSLEAGLLRRLRHDRAQAGLGKKERRGNAAGSFAADAACAGKSIWLVDDVMTTGSTLEAACEALLDAGSTRVSVLFVARTPLYSGSPQ